VAADQGVYRTIDQAGGGPPDHINGQSEMVAGNLDQYCLAAPVCPRQLKGLGEIMQVKLPGPLEVTTSALPGSGRSLLVQ
jgi:hypothetical protein